MKITRNHTLLVLILVSRLTYNNSALASPDPTQALPGIIWQFQTGMLNLSWYGSQLMYELNLEGANNGFSPQLLHLGRVLNINLAHKQELPQGSLYGLIARHENGTSVWLIGIGSRRVEYIEYDIRPSLSFSYLPSSQENFTSHFHNRRIFNLHAIEISEACQKYPGLC